MIDDGTAKDDGVGDERAEELRVSVDTEFLVKVVYTVRVSVVVVVVVVVASTEFTTVVSCVGESSTVVVHSCSFRRASLSSLGVCGKHSGKLVAGRQSGKRTDRQAGRQDGWLAHGQTATGSSLSAT